MVERHTVTVVDTTGDQPSVKRSNSYEELDDALDAVRTLADFINFETERIELGGDDTLRAWLDGMETVERTRTPHYWTPQVGEVMNDPEAPHWSNGDVRVTEVTDTPADEYELDDAEPWVDTVADANPSHPSDAPVILAEYVSGSGKEYAFPVHRLDRT